MIDSSTYLLPPSYDNSVLTCNSNAADGSGLSWRSTLNTSYIYSGTIEAISLSADAYLTSAGQLSVTGTYLDQVQMVVSGNAAQTHHLTAWESSAGAVLAFVGSAGDGHFASVTTAGAVSAASAVLTGGIAVHGIASPPVQAAFPGTADGVAADDATVINAIVATLIAYGFVAPFVATTTLSGGDLVGAATVQCADPFVVTLSAPAPAGGVVITPSGTLSGDTFQAALLGTNVTSVTIAAGGTTVQFYLTPGADGTDHVSFTTSPITTYAGTPKTVTVSG
jgi:hypothetical protein